MRQEAKRKNLSTVATEEYAVEPGWLEAYTWHAAAEGHSGPKQPYPPAGAVANADRKTQMMQGATVGAAGGNHALRTAGEINATKQPLAGRTYQHRSSVSTECPRSPQECSRQCPALQKKEQSHIEMIDIATDEKEAPNVDSTRGSTRGGNVRETTARACYHTKSHAKDK